MRGGGGLFEVEPVEKQQPQGRGAAVDKRFRAFDPHQVLLLPPSLDDWLPQDHLARFVADLVDDVLDLTAIRADYTEKRGYPPYDPRLMLRPLIYGYTTGVRSSRAIERRCAEDIAFRYLAADQAPDFGRLAEAPQSQGARLTPTSRDGSGTLLDVLHLLDTNGLVPRTVGVRESSLDDVFLGLTGHGTHTGPAASTGTSGGPP